VRQELAQPKGQNLFATDKDDEGIGAEFVEDLQTGTTGWGWLFGSGEDCDGGYLFFAGRYRFEDGGAFRAHC